MSKSPLETWTFETFDGSSLSTEATHRRLSKGSTNQIITGNGKPQAFKGNVVFGGADAAKRGSQFLTNAGDGYAGLGDYATTDVKGSVFKILQALFFVGNGALRYNGAATGSSASSILQIKLLASGGYAGVTYQAGLSQPTAPTLATRTTLGVGMTGKLKNGTFSAKIAKIRTATGAKSLGSLTSNTIVAVEASGTGRSARITFPAIGTGADKWAVYVTARNFGSTGPHYFLKEIAESEIRRTLSGDVTVTNTDATMDSPTGAFTAADIGRYISVTNGVTTLVTTIASINSATSVELTDVSTFTSSAATATISMSTVDSVPFSAEIEWSDGDLIGGELAPIDSFVPPAAMFGGALGDSAFLDGCYGDTVTNPATRGVTAAEPGSTIVMSLPLRPEEYPPDWTLYPPEPPTALLRGGDGFYYRFGKSTMGVLSYVGGDDQPPLAFQLMWANQGISYAHNACVGTGGRLYAKCGKNLVRLGADGNPETFWSAPVADQMAVLDDSKTVLGWDGDSHSLVVMNGEAMWVYNEQMDSWGAPIDQSTLFAGDITAAVTQANKLIIAGKDLGASDIKLYTYNTGAGTTYSSQTDWRFAADDTDTLRQLDIVMRADNIANDVTVNVYGNEDDTASLLTQTLTVRKTGTVKLQPIRAALPSLESFCVKLTHTSTGGDASFEVVRAFGFTRRIVT